MEKIKKEIEVKAPMSTVYNQWTQFEEFPKFMEGVKYVHQLDDTHLRWEAEIGGKEKSWDAEIVEQIPDQKIAWRSISGALNNGLVLFQRLNSDTTRVTLELEYDPEGITENVGDALGFVSLRIGGDLQRFKEFIESRGQETGAWRGSVDHSSFRSIP